MLTEVGHAWSQKGGLPRLGVGLGPSEVLYDTPLVDLGFSTVELSAGAREIEGGTCYTSSDANKNRNTYSRGVESPK